jgi:hypothetical protein
LSEARWFAEHLVAIFGPKANLVMNIALLAAAGEAQR